MKTTISIYSKLFILTGWVAFILAISCSDRDADIDELDLAAFPTTGEVFIDGFSSGLQYAAYGTSKVSAFGVDEEVSYEGSSSIKIEVPANNDPLGGYAGGNFYDVTGRDLTGYNVLTFWAKASRADTINEIGFGSSDRGNKYRTSLQNLYVDSNWEKYYIPFPDPSKLTQETGMLYFSEAASTGYTLWIDEVKFENLGTIVFKQASILNGVDKIENAVNGLSIPINELSASFNLPNGTDQNMNVASSYFTFTSSDTTVATVDDMGIVTVINAGTSVITARLGNVDAVGSLTIESSGEFEHAPVPTADSTDVISVFSNAYTNISVDFYNGYWEPYQTTQSADFRVDNDDVLNYLNFNFVGIQFSASPVNATNMTHLHLDLWIPNAVTSTDKLLIKIVDMGSDGVLGDPDESISVLYESPDPLVSQTWIGLDIDLSALASKDKIAQIILENLGSPLSGFYLDNIYFYNDGGGGGGTTAPTVAASTPTQAAADVISVYSDAYTDISGTDFNPGWGQATTQSETAIAGNNTFLYSGLDYQGIVLGSAQDVSTMEFLHIDYWTANSTALNTFLISSGPVETAKALTVPTGGGWTSVDIPLSDFSPVDLADIIQLKFDGNGDIYLDNIYFYKTAGGGTVPTVAAPTPTQAAADVISVYSDAYTDISGSDFNPGWGQATTQSETAIAGNNTFLYSGLDYQGIVLGSAQDVSTMEFLHIDYWTANSTALNTFLISSGPVETAKALTVPTGGGWTSVDIPLSDFSPVDLADIIQLKFDGNGDIYLDNIYFYKTAGGGTVPTVAAPTPTQAAADVISVYSDAYTDISGSDFNPGWGQATTQSETAIAGNNTFLYSGLDYQGIVLGSAQDVSTMEFLHIDYWTANSTALNTFLISSGPVETAKALTVPTGGGWTSVDIPLSDFSPVDLADIIQLKFDGNGDIYLDNIYFYKTAGGGAYNLTLPIDFEASGFGAGWTWNVFENGANPPLEFVANPDPSGINTSSTVAKITAFQAGQPWVGCETAHGEMGITFTLDATNTTVKIMVYKSVISDVGIKFATPSGGAQTEIKVANTVINQWEELTFDFSGYIGFGDTNGLDQIIIFPDFDLSGRTSDNVVYFDNITFNTSGGGTVPTVAAPTPTQAAADVISVYSDAYTDISGTDFNPAWGQATVQSETAIAGNNTQLYAGLNYQGIALGSSQDVSTMEYLHIDYWTANSTALNTFLISSGPVETAKALTVPTGGGWTSVDIPLSDFSPVDLADIIQLKFDGNGDIYLDNIYFYKTAGGGAYNLTLPIDFEASGFGAGWTWNVFENGANSPLEFVANPDQSGINTSSTVAKITALQAGQPWVGCETAHGEMGITFTLDATNTTVKIMVYKSVISDVGIKFATPSGGAQTEIKVANTVINQWEELTFDFSGYIGFGDTNGLDQIIIFPDFDLSGRTSDNVVYFDNITFN